MRKKSSIVTNISIKNMGMAVLDQKRTLLFSADSLLDQILKKVDSLFDQKKSLI